MEYRSLGNAGLKVSEIGLGGNTFGWWADEKKSITVINHAIEQGINFIDTADIYGQGQSEEYVGKALKGKRNEVIIATKFSSPMGEAINEKGGSRYYIMKAVDASLKRLQTDYIDLYQMHFPDTETPIEETLLALDDLVRSGKVRYIGCSNFAAWQLSEALWTSSVKHLHSFVTVQPQYNLLTRQIEKELVPCCQAHNVSVIPYSPLAGGFLTGKYIKGKEKEAEGRLSRQNERTRKLFVDQNWEKLVKLEGFAKDREHTVGELAMAWLLSKPWICSVIAGSTKIEQVSANVAACDWKLTADEVSEIEEMA